MARLLFRFLCRYQSQHYDEDCEECDVVYLQANLSSNHAYLCLIATGGYMQQQEASEFTLEIARQPLFQELPVDAVAQICAQGVVRTFHVGDVLISENETNSSLFLILQGKGKVIMNGTEVGVVEKDEIIGEISVSRLSLPLASVIAVAEMAVVIFPAIAIQDFMLKYEGFGKAIKSMALARIYNPS